MIRRLPKRAKKKSQDVSGGWPLVVYMWMFGLGIFGYVAGRIAFDAFPHPVHWSAGLAGIVIGYGLGWVWFRVKGDVV